VTDRSYIRVYWRHDSADDPVELWSELNVERFETRKLEIFRDGRVGYASADEEYGGTRLGFAVVPPISEIASDVQFEPEEVSRAAFENLWNKLRG
jgi:hypothetical protein